MNSADTDSPAVELRGIHKQFGPRPILDGIDLAIAQGEVLVLVGPAAAAKARC